MFYICWLITLILMFTWPALIFIFTGVFQKHNEYEKLYTFKGSSWDNYTLGYGQKPLEYPLSFHSHLVPLIPYSAIAKQFFSEPLFPHIIVYACGQAHTLKQWLKLKRFLKIYKTFIFSFPIGYKSIFVYYKYIIFFSTIKPILL